MYVFGEYWTRFNASASQQKGDISVGLSSRSLDDWKLHLIKYLTYSILSSLDLRGKKKKPSMTQRRKLDKFCLSKVKVTWIIQCMQLSLSWTVQTLRFERCFVTFGVAGLAAMSQDPAWISAVISRIIWAASSLVNATETCNTQGRYSNNSIVKPYMYRKRRGSRASTHPLQNSSLTQILWPWA